jgi:methionine aminotransferase
VHIPLMPPEFVIDWERLESSLGRKTRLIVINSPNNPTGAVLGSEDLDRLAALIRRWGCYVLSDEVYEHIVFDGAGHASVLSHAELAERSFAVFSFGKTYHATGWKVGYCVAPPALTEQLRRVHQFVTFATAAPFQYALADFLRGHPDHDSGLSAFYQQKRDLFVRLLKETGFAVRPARGTYFQLADYSGISELEDQAFSRWLTTRHGVAVIPVSAFYEDPPQARLVRFCFAKQEPTLLEAACRLQAI